MAKRGPPRKPRAPRVPVADFGTPYHLRQRLALCAPESSAEMLRILSIPERKRSQEDLAILSAITRAVARRPHLSHPVGIAFENRVFEWKDERLQTHDGIELLWAADHYAALHRRVWGPLHRDIETEAREKWGANSTAMLRQVGRIGAPPPVSNVWRNLIAGEARPANDDCSPEDYRKRRWRSTSRYWAARKALAAVAPAALTIVEAVVLSAVMPRFLVVPATEMSRQDIAERELFVSGLRALAEQFGLLE